MALTPRTPTWSQSCRVPFCLSLALHVLAGVLLWAWPSSGEAPRAATPVVDTRVRAPGPEIEVTLVLGEPERPRVRGRVPNQIRRTEARGWPNKSVAPSKAPATQDRHEEKPTTPSREAFASRPPSAQAPEALSRSSAGGNVSGPQVAARRSGHSPSDARPFGPGAQSTTFFQIPATGKSIVYAIDRSASMGLNGAFAAAQHELIASLEQLRPDCSFQIIAYNRFAEPLHLGGTAGLLPASVEYRRQAEQYVQSLAAEGGTDHLPALRRALALRPDVIYFLTDAADLTAEQIQGVTLWNQGRTVIHAIELASAGRGGDTVLAALARRNGGTYRAVTSEPPLSLVRH